MFCSSLLRCIQCINCKPGRVFLILLATLKSVSWVSSNWACLCGSSKNPARLCGSSKLILSETIKPESVNLNGDGSHWKQQVKHPWPERERWHKASLVSVLRCVLSRQHVTLLPAGCAVTWLVMWLGCPVKIITISDLSISTTIYLSKWRFSDHKASKSREWAVTWHVTLLPASGMLRCQVTCHVTCHVTWLSRDSFPSRVLQWLPAHSGTAQKNWSVL